MIAEPPNFSIKFFDARLCDLVKTIVFCVLVKDPTDAVSDTVARRYRPIVPAASTFKESPVAKQAAVGHRTRYQQCDVALDSTQANTAKMPYFSTSS